MASNPKIRRLQNELTIIESDVRKMRRLLIPKRAEFRARQTDFQRLKQELTDRTAELTRLERELGMAEAELVAARKRLNTEPREI